MLFPSQDGTISSLAALSRNASVISSSSSSDSVVEGDLRLLATPVRPRPLRTFSSPRSASPSSPITRTPRPPSYLTKELGLSDDLPKSRAASKVRSKSRVSNELSIDDFDVGETLGEGSYSTVLEATLRKTGKKYAIKVLDKTHLARKNKTFTVKIERLALIRLGRAHPGIISLYWTFQDEYSLYFVLDLAPNGEMQSLISRMGSLSLLCSRYYAAQIVDALEYMHSKGVIHRDLKPENLLLDASYRLKIADFGTAKILNADVETERFVGTAQYIAPELVVANESSESSDLWALGCVLYQMISGRFAFSALSEYLTLQKVKQVEYTFPEGFDNNAKDLVQKLLVREPTDRLGAGEPSSSLGMSALRSHPFFESIIWATLWTEPAPPILAGLVQREYPLGQGQDKDWQDVGATWDALVMDDDVGPVGDDIDWADDAEGSSLLLRQRQCDTSMSPVDLSLVSQVIPGDLDEGHRGLSGSADSTAAMPITIPSSVARAESPPSGSPESSSDGDGSVERVAAGLQAMKPFRFTSNYSEIAVERERGRSQAPTPIQGNTSSTIELPLALNPEPDEVVIYRSIVEDHSARRRANRLLKPIPGAQIKPKARELILTNYRLICVKAKTPPSYSSVKLELFLKAVYDREKEKKKDGKEMKGILESADLKGGRDFIVISSIKTFHYTVQDASTASVFVQRINEAKSSSNYRS
ncbi:kinase-like domain-containing protein [Lentinula edodes]|uniref:non-specific serine/threonine protein kinase n=1 Tax=Lentinula lateritia TaxID=40482 RepID=A0A9W9E0F7_9AGAR|nr:kinase-like domain-containing protein [Lentinula edodes]